MEEGQRCRFMSAASPMLSKVREMAAFAVEGQAMVGLNGLSMSRKVSCVCLKDVRGLWMKIGTYCVGLQNENLSSELGMQRK